MSRSGRNPKDVTLIAVSKTKPNEMLMDAYNAGMRTFRRKLCSGACL